MKKWFQQFGCGRGEVHGPVTLMVAMTRQKVSQRLVDDQLEELLEPLTPPPPRAKKGRTGRPRVADRGALEGIVFVAEHGLAWEKLPTELGLGSGITCWGRLRAWQEAGVWDKLHHAVLDQLGQDGALDCSRASLDAVSARATKGGELTGSNPTARGRFSPRYRLLVSTDGLAQTVAVTRVNRHDSMLVEPILDGLSQVKDRGRGRPRRRPDKLHADKAYDNKGVRRYLRRRGIPARIARIGVDSSDRLGRYRWVVERTIPRLLTFRRLALPCDRSATTITAVATWALTVICARRLLRKDHGNHFSRGPADARSR